jgi:hypothetical protein
MHDPDRETAKNASIFQKIQLSSSKTSVSKCFSENQVHIGS